MTPCAGKVAHFHQSNRPEPSNQSGLASLLIEMGTPQGTALVLVQIWKSRMDEILKYCCCATGAKTKLLSLSCLDMSEFSSSHYSQAVCGHLCHHFLLCVGFAPPWPRSELLQLSSTSTFLPQALLRHFILRSTILWPLTAFLFSSRCEWVWYTWHLWTWHMLQYCWELHLHLPSWLHASQWRKQLHGYGLF